MIRCSGSGGDYLQACLIKCSVDVERFLCLSSLPLSCHLFLPAKATSILPVFLHRPHLCPLLYVLQGEKSLRGDLLSRADRIASCYLPLGSGFFTFVILELLHNRRKLMLLTKPPGRGGALGTIPGTAFGQPARVTPSCWRVGIGENQRKMGLRDQS